MTANWTPSSWRDLPIQQVPYYPDAEALADVEAQLQLVAHHAVRSHPFELGASGAAGALATDVGAVLQAAEQHPHIQVEGIAAIGSVRDVGVGGGGLEQVQVALVGARALTTTQAANKQRKPCPGAHAAPRIQARGRPGRARTGCLQRGPPGTASPVGASESIMARKAACSVATASAGPTRLKNTNPPGATTAAASMR